MKPIIFDEYNPNWTQNSERNLVFLRTQQQYFNQLLHARGHVFLNEVYDALSLVRTVDGVISGWSLALNPDSRIDFGLGGIGYDALSLVRTVDGVISGWSLALNPDSRIDFGLGGIGEAVTKMTKFSLVFNIDGVMFHTIEK